MKTVKEISILVGLASVLAFSVNFLSPAGIALVGQWDTSRGVVTAREKNDTAVDGMEIDSVDQARKLYDSGEYTFVDARSSEDYADGHIKGAVSLPVGRFEEKIAVFLEHYSPATPIVTYCSGRTCEDSHHLAEYLLAAGYEKIGVFIDGFPGWEAQGHPIE